MVTPDFDNRKYSPPPSWAVGVLCAQCGKEFETWYQWEMRHTDAGDKNSWHHEACCPFRDGDKED